METISTGAAQAIAGAIIKAVARHVTRANIITSPVAEKALNIQLIRQADDNRPHIRACRACAFHKSATQMIPFRIAGHLGSP
jgi:hypothetical protein